VAVSVAEPRPVLERYVNLGVTVGETILVACFVSMLLVTKWLRLSTESPGRAGQQMMLWIAQGFGVGRVPVAPGTVGSVLGIVWFALLAATGRVWAVILGTVLGLGLSIWLCGVAESMLGQKDPGSAVLDEIAAMPVCFLSWIGILIWKTGSRPTLEEFFSGRNWFFTLGVFVLFRFFDVVKPWPVRQSQLLRGGWGITIDDLLAAFYVSCSVLIGFTLKSLISR